MRPIVPYDMTRIAPAKNHAQGGRISGTLQIRFEHIGGVSCQTLTDEIKIQDNILNLKQPDWVFLDEATSALDEDSEAQMYGLLTELDNTTFISIGHRSTIDKHHQRIVKFEADDQKRITPLDMRHTFFKPSAVAANEEAADQALTFDYAKTGQG